MQNKNKKAEREIENKVYFDINHSKTTIASLADCYRHHEDAVDKNVAFCYK